MLLIQLVPLIQFNVYYTLHSKNNNRNNFLVIGFMLLIQFRLIINLTFHTLHINNNNSHNFIIIIKRILLKCHR